MRVHHGAIKNEQGLTLVEVLVAIIIIGVALVPVMSMFATGLFTYSKAGTDTLAVNLAQGILEEVMALPYDSVVSRPTADYTGQSYQYEIVVLDYNPARRLKEVRVAVWPQDDPAKRTEVVTLVGGR
ncbi:MAG: type IV pilus modification PilV family protein [Bacillota bacterium]